jgi:TPR repeat protein
MSGQIFVSYRREDAPSAAGWLYERLKEHFARDQIFLDVDNIPPGVDFVEAIDKSVSACDVFIAVIGRRWLVVRDAKWRRRLNNPKDFVRLEITTALKRGIRVIPVLVEGASMPRPDELPNELKPLVRRNALTVSPDRFRTDAERLIGAVERALEDAQVELQRKREDQERVEAERREHEEKERVEAARRAQAQRLGLERQQEEQARLRAEQQLRAGQERLKAERRQREAQDRLEVERQEKGRQAEVEQREVEPCQQEEQERLRAEQPLRAAQEPLQAEQRERERLETERREIEALGGMGADSRAPPSNRTPSKEGAANLKRPWRSLVVMGIGIMICLLGFGLFKATRPPSVSIGGSSSPTAAPLAAASNSPSPTALVSPASPSPSPSGAERLITAASPVPPIPTVAPSGSPALPIVRGSTLIRESPALLTKPSVSLLATPTSAPLNSPSPMFSVSQASPPPTPSGSEWYAEAESYLVVKDYAKALPLLKQAAEAANAEAMNQLGELYYYGSGVVEDNAKAGEWFQKAAEAGNAKGMFQLGSLYENGLGTARDYVRARHWYLKAAEAGNASAMTNLGSLYEHGLGVAQDYAQARQWYQKAADAGDSWAGGQLSALRSKEDWFAEAKRYLGAKDYAQALPLLQKSAKADNAEAMNNLGSLYENGLGTARDYVRARHWYLKAAEAGNAGAMTNLGRHALGVAQDYAQARQWFQKAADAGDADAKQALTQLPSK